MATVAEEDLEAPCQQDGKLAPWTRNVALRVTYGISQGLQFVFVVVLVFIGIVRTLIGLGDGEHGCFSRFGDNALGEAVGFVVGESVFLPGFVPITSVAVSELRVDVFGIVDAEVMIDGLGGAVVNNATFVDYQDGVI